MIVIQMIIDSDQILEKESIRKYLEITWIQATFHIELSRNTKEIKYKIILDMNEKYGSIWLSRITIVD